MRTNLFLKKICSGFLALLLILPPVGISAPASSAGKHLSPLSFLSSVSPDDWQLKDLAHLEVLNNECLLKGVIFNAQDREKLEALKLSLGVQQVKVIPNLADPSKKSFYVFLLWQNSEGKFLSTIHVGDQKFHPQQIKVLLQKHPLSKNLLRFRLKHLIRAIQSNKKKMQKKDWYPLLKTLSQFKILGKVYKGDPVVQGNIMLDLEGPSSSLVHLQQKLILLGVDPEKAVSLANSFHAGTFKLSGEELDVIRVDKKGHQKVLGSLDRSIVMKAGLDHRISGIMVLTPNGQKILFPRRTHDVYVFPKQLSVFGGYVSKGETYQQTIERELREELNLEGSLSGTLYQIGREGNWNVPEAPHQWRSKYVYVLSSGEWEEVQKYINDMVQEKKTKTVHEYEQWVENEKSEHDGYGEHWGIYDFELTELRTANGFMNLTDQFRDGLYSEQIAFTGDNLAPLMKDQNFLKVLETISATLIEGKPLIQGQLEIQRLPISETKVKTIEIKDVYPLLAESQIKWAA